MKTYRPHNSNSRKESGSVLVTTLVLGAILGLTLSGYLYWVRTQNLLVAESQAWNAALAHAEAGVEEAMAQVNVAFGTNYHSSATANWGGSVSSGVYGPRKHDFMNGSLTNGSYSVIILPTFTNTGPVIISTGYAMVPIVGRQIARTIMVDTRCFRAFGNAVTAIDDVQMNGNNVTVDSYDSFDPNFSTPTGLYDRNKRKAGGDVSSANGIINVANGNIYGHLHTAPWGNATIGNQGGRVGDLNFAGPGIQEGWYLKDFNSEYPSVTPPFSGGDSVPDAVNGTNVLATADYLVGGDFTIANNNTLLVVGNARLWVQGNFRMASQTGSFIEIAPGATLTIYVGTENGPAVDSVFTTVNNAGNAANFCYYGLPSNVALTWGGNASYMGTVYAPQAVFTLNGGGANSETDYQGSCVVKSVVMTGHFNVHYDENLNRRGPVSGWIVRSWREI